MKNVLKYVIKKRERGERKLQYHYSSLAMPTGGEILLVPSIEIAVYRVQYIAQEKHFPFDSFFRS